MARASAHRRLAGTVALALTAVALTAPAPASSGNAYTTNPNVGSVTPFDVFTNVLAPPIPVGDAPRGIAITPDGSTAYVANEASGTVTPIDLATNLPGLPIGVGQNPTLVAVTPDGTAVYVTNLASDTVSKIDTASQTVTATVAVGPVPNGIAITPDGTKGYVSLTGADAVVPLDIETDTTRPPIPVGAAPTGMAITPDGSTLYVGNFADGTVTPIDTATDTAGVPIPVDGTPADIAITPDGTIALVATGWANTVAPIDTATNVPGTPIAALDMTPGIAITPDGRTAYAANVFGNQITAIDTATTATTPVAIGRATGHVEAVPAQPPVAAFGVVAGGPGAASSFDATASSDPDGTVARYAWDFGDGETETSADPTTTHVYAKPGTYTATLTVTDDENCSGAFVYTGQTASCNGSAVARVSHAVTVGAPPQPAPAPATAGPTTPTTAVLPPGASQAVERFALASRCVTAGRSGKARVSVRLRLAEPGPVQVRIDRAIGARGRCPSANPRRRFTGTLRTVDTLRRVPTRPAAASVRRRFELDLKLAPGLYRISVRAYGTGGKLTRPLSRWVRVLGA